MQDDTSECRESFRDLRKMYGMSQFDENLKRSSGKKKKKKEKIEEKHLQTDEFVEDS